MDRHKTRQLIIDLDRTFSLESQTTKEEAWKKVLSEDAVMISSGHDPNLVGKDIIYQALKRFYTTPDLVFKWEPQLVDISDDLSLGYASGIYERSYTVDGKKIKEIGKYTNVWKNIDGEWKIVLDIGNIKQVDPDTE